MAAFRPSWASDVASCTPDRPRAFSERRNADVHAALCTQRAPGSQTWRCSVTSSPAANYLPNSLAFQRATASGRDGQ